MLNNNSRPRTSPSTGHQTRRASVDVTAVFRLAGMPQTTSASAGFEKKYHLLAADHGTDHYDIVWGVRCVLSGCLPARPLRTRRGKALLLELPSFQNGACEDIGVVIECHANHVHLMLPEEFEEPVSCRLLVAESEVEIARMVTLLLGSEGFDVSVAGSAAATLALLQKETFDLALLDVDLPDGSAFALCSRLRATPATETLPVVICSAWPGLDRRAIEAGAVGYIEKPSAFLNLAERLWQYLRP